ncbi:hypothetical protein RCC89_04665 [Cytophagaceae bacterium ABcell3]|nr:hypothetical protein RCC89_04665 [Cytophagaceae bacterium ABcell3]
MKTTTIIKQGDISHLPELSAAIVLNGVIYSITAKNLTLYVLNQNLQVVKQVDIPEGQDCEYLINHLNINGYPHLVLFPKTQTNNTLSFLIKLPTKFNRDFLVFSTQGAADFFRLLSYNEDITTSGALNLKGMFFLPEKAIFVQENKASLALLSADMDEITEFVQGHAAGIPFPVIKKTSKDPNAAVKGMWNFHNNYFLLLETPEGKYQIKVYSDLELTKKTAQHSLPVDNKQATFLHIYEKDNDTYVGLTILKNSEKQFLGMLEITI